MVTPAMGTAMKGPMDSLRESGAQYGGHMFPLRLSTFRGSWLSWVRALGVAQLGDKRWNSRGGKSQKAVIINNWEFVPHSKSDPHPPLVLWA